jgi:hypothetical protein
MMSATEGHSECSVSRPTMSGVEQQGTTDAVVNFRLEKDKQNGMVSEANPVVRPARQKR